MAAIRRMAVMATGTPEEAAEAEERVMREAREAKDARALGAAFNRLSTYKSGEPIRFDFTKVPPTTRLRYRKRK